MGAEIRAQGAREVAEKAAQEADRAEADPRLVSAYGRLWRAGAAISNHRPMP